MALTQDEVNRLAADLIRQHNDTYEYSDICENDEILEMTEDEMDWVWIHNTMYGAELTITIDGKEY